MVDWAKVAFVFPGQGSQTVGMGRDVAEAYPVAQQTFEQADDMLGFKLSALCFDGSEGELNDTLNTQPALFTCGVAMLRALQTEMPEARAVSVAGHSLGEFTALTVAGAVSFEDGLRLVRERGRLMKEAGEKSPGAMAALLGLDAEQVKELCTRASQQTGGVLILANDNCPGQSVISGDDATIEVGMKLAQEAKAKKVVKLAVSIAAHSPLMESASAEFRKAIESTHFDPPQVPIYGNVEAAALKDIEAVRRELELQLTHSVRWTETVQAMSSAGVELFLELGPKDVLTGLLKRIDRSRTGKAINGLEALQKFASENR
jgi:[acyl-carrier-protein] S-malonyltransferase